MADEAKRAERKIAALLLTDLDVDVTPEQVRAFIRQNWRTLAPLAHIVHAAPDYTKDSGSGGVAGRTRSSDGW